MNETPAFKNQKGLTLIELMASFFILTVVLGMSLYLLLNAHAMSKEARNRLLALNAARSVLEAIKTTSLTSVPAINTATYLPNNLPSGTMTITTNPVNLNGVSVATVTVTVGWRGSKNMTRSLTVTTMRSRY